MSPFALAYPFKSKWNVIFYFYVEIPLPKKIIAIISNDNSHVIMNQWNPEIELNFFHISNAYRSSNFTASFLSISIPNSLNATTISSKSTIPETNQSKNRMSAVWYDLFIQFITIFIFIQTWKLQLQIFLVLAHIIDKFIKAHIAALIMIWLSQEFLRLQGHW